MRKIAWMGVALLLGGAWVAAGGQALAKDSLVREKCTGCHAEKGGRIARVHDIRTTPEEWTVIIDRMYRLHGMDLTTAEMDGLLKELCATQILTPAEAAPVAYLDLYNNPQNIEIPEGAEQERLFAACVRCHSAGKIFSYRMTADAWTKVRDFHLYVDPAIMFQMREMRWIEEADAILGYLGKKYAYGRDWKAPADSPAGSWFITGEEPGKGYYRGEATIEAAGDGEFTVKGDLTFHDGTRETFTADATLYGGYALRMRGKGNGRNLLGAYRFVDGVIRGQRHFEAPEFRNSSSTWVPAGSNTSVLRVTPGYLVTGETTTITVEGTGLGKIRAEDLAFSNGEVEVLWARPIDANAVEAGVVYRAAGHGSAALRVRGQEAGSVTLTPSVDYIAVSPETGRARVSGGRNYPAEGVQFQTTAYSNGADISDPSDDVALGPVAASYRLEEYATRPGDEDLTWAGDIDRDGTYLPTGSYEPISAREYGGEGTGMVKVVASYERGGREYLAESKLVVTVPDYIQRIR
jgi:hypothetical protein